ncbi:MAG: BolA family protein [Alphaproteobacteria bacterium]
MAAKEGTVLAGMQAKLTAAFTPDHLEIIDESDRHKGHMGARPGGETHFRVLMTSAAFDGLSRVARQQKVHAVLAEELAGPVHALSMRLHTPDEASQD